MRIVQVSVGSVRMPPSEGSAPLQVIFNTSKHLARMNHQVIILDRKYSKDDPDVDHVEGVEIARLKVMQVPLVKAPGFIRFILAEINAVLFALAVSRHLRKNSASIDVIHLHLTSIGLILSLLNKKLREKMFYTCHLSQWALVATELKISERIHLYLDSLVMKRVNKVIALNDAAKESFISRGSVSENRIVGVPNGVDTEFFSPSIEGVGATKKKFGLEGKLRVLFVGRLAKIKGVEPLLRAADVIVNYFGHKDTLFLFVGSNAFAGVDAPVDMDEICGYLERCQLDRNVLFTGSLGLDDIRSLYAAADIFVLPSLAEGDPLVTLEAMASGLPVIATRVGGIPNQIRDNWNGFIVDPGNEEQLAERIAYLLDNPEERKRMALNSRRRAEEEFDWNKISERLSQVYQSCVAVE